MSKRLGCPVEGCHASIEAETEDEIMEQAQEHAASLHPELTLDEETAANSRSQIVDA
jgi:predicted small metal-binding protein